MSIREKWYFTSEQLADSPSRKCGVLAAQELIFRQEAANFIQKIGARVKITQLGINTAIVYMHRFYVFHSFTKFHRTDIAIAALFLAAKTEEQPRKMDHIVRAAITCLNEDRPMDIQPNRYPRMKENLLFNENVLLQTLGFDIAIEHPHPHIVRCCELVRAGRELCNTAYFLASNSLHLTPMCLQYKPSVVACLCIHIACKWANLEIPQSNEGKSWFWYIDKSVTQELLKKLIDEFFEIFDKCPSKLKQNIIDAHKMAPLSGYPFGEDINKKGNDSNLPTFLAQFVQANQSHSSGTGAGTFNKDEQKRRIDVSLRPPSTEHRDSHKQLSARDSRNCSYSSFASQSLNDNEDVINDSKNNRHKRLKKREHSSKTHQNVAVDDHSVNSLEEAIEKPFKVKIKLIKISPNVPINSDIAHGEISSTGARKADHASDQVLTKPNKIFRGRTNSNGYKPRSEVNYPRLQMSWYRPRFHQQPPPQRMHRPPYYHLHQPMLMFPQQPLYNQYHQVPMYNHNQYANQNFIPFQYSYPPPPPLPIGPPPVTPPLPPLPPPE